MSVYVVRHAHAGKRSAWTADDHRRPLSDKGWRQAKALVEVFSGRPLSRVLSSPYDRCVQTVEPLAAARGLKVETHEDLAEATPREQVRELLWSLTSDVAVCSHGDVIGDLVGEMRLRGVDLPPDPSWPKGSVWALQLNGRSIEQATYVAPPAT